MNTPLNNFEHALLYSIGVNLPAHRVGQLDRVLVVSSPINDINILAWDINRVKRFIELDIGIRMELCPDCLPQGHKNTSITFIVEKSFIRDCMNFLCREARIPNSPQTQDGLTIHNLQHQCGYCTAPNSPPPPPPPYEPPEKEKPLLNGGQSSPSFSPPQLPPKPQVSFLDEWSLDSRLSGPGPSEKQEERSESPDSDLPPRCYKREDHQTSIPAMAQPYLNFQPHLFNRHCFEGPYQISSRIIITDSGELQFERSILGSTPHSSHGGFQFNKQKPLPPRRTQVQVQNSSASQCFTFPPRAPNASSADNQHTSVASQPPQIPPKQGRNLPPPLFHRSSDSLLEETRGPKLVKRASEVSQGENGEYVITTSPRSSDGSREITPPAQPPFPPSHPSDDVSADYLTVVADTVEPSGSPTSPDVVSVSVQVSHGCTEHLHTDNLQQPPPRCSPTLQQKPPKPAVPPRRIRSHSNVADSSYNSTLQGSSAWQHEPECHSTHKKVVTRGDDQAGLLDHGLTSSEFDGRIRRGSDEANDDTCGSSSSNSTKRPVPTPRSRKRRSRTVLGLNVSVQLNDV